MEHQKAEVNGLNWHDFDSHGSKKIESYKYLGIRLLNVISLPNHLKEIKFKIIKSLGIFSLKVSTLNFAFAK